MSYNNEITADSTVLMDQAPSTVAVYFNRACKILSESVIRDAWGTKDAIALCDIMAKDFNNSIQAKILEAGLAKIAEALCRDH